MKKSTPILIYCLFINLLFLHGQDFQKKIDSLKLVYQQSSNAIEQTDALNDISFAFYRYSPDSILFYANKALAIAQKAKYNKGLIQADLRTAVGMSKKGMSQDSVVNLFIRVAKKAKEIKAYNEEVSAWNNAGLVMMYEAKYNKAIYYLLQAAHLFEEHDLAPSRLQGIILGNLGLAHNNINDHNKALIYLEKALKLAQEIDEPFIPSIYIDILAQVKHQLNRTDEAINDILDVMPLQKQIGDYSSLAKSLLTLSQLSLDQGEIEQAYLYVNQAANIAKERSFFRIHTGTLVALAEILYAKGDAEQAIVYALESLNSLQPDAANDRLKLKVTDVLAKSYHQQNKLDLAYQYTQEHKLILEKTKDSEITLLATRLENEFENEKKALLIQQLEKEKQAQKKTQFILVGISISLIILLILLIRAMQQKNTATQILSEKNTELSLAENNLNKKNKELQQYIDSNLQLENFAHIASHDLRQPMRNIVSFSQLLNTSARAKLNQAELDYLDYINKSVRRIEGLTNGLLAYSKIRNEATVFDVINMDNIVNQAWQDLGLLVKEENASLVKDHFPVNIKADANRIYQLLLNLFSNAIRYCKTSEPPNIHFFGYEEEEVFHFCVCDNGIGIDAQFHEQIFILFETLEIKTEKANSTGVGLAICKKIIEDHGGEIWLESNDRQGSRFHFTINKIN